MKPHIQSPLTLGSAWVAFATLAIAQAPDLSISPPRIPRPPLEQSDVPTALDPSPTARPAPVRSQPISTARTPDATESGKVTTIRSSDDRFSRLYWDTDAEGTTWVRGRQYKASFGPDGATYYPLFGSKQPKHYPLQISLASATSNGQPISLAPITGAVREGDHVIIHRGVVDEVYEMSVDGVEQTFVVGDRPQGDLKLFVSLQTELPKSERADGFEFTDEMGSVRYGRAFSREPGGARRALTTRGTDGGVEIDVEAAYVASAQFPLVVDPLVTTFTVHSSMFSDVASDVAYDATTDRYLFLAEELVTTSTDADVYSELRSSNGSVIASSYVDQTLALWSDPSVANLNAYDRFMIAAASTGGSVVGRQTNASLLSYGPVITISGPDSHVPVQFASIGGDSFPIAPAYFCVAYLRGSVSGGVSIDVRLVTDSGSLVGSSPILLDDPTGIETHLPRVSKGNGSNQWNIVWNRRVAAGDSVWAGQVRWDGSSIVTPGFQIAAAGSVYERASVSSPLGNGTYLVAYEYDFGTDFDILAALVSGGTILGTADLSLLDSPGQLFDDQKLPVVDCDGQQFTVVYNEPLFGGAAYRGLLSTFHVLGSTLGVSEARIDLGPMFPDNFAFAIVSAYSTGGTSRRCAWTSQFRPVIGAQLHTQGGFYDGIGGGPITTSCSGDATGTMCPCGNNGTSGHGCANSVNSSGALLEATGQATILGDNVVLLSSGMPTTASCLFFQGTVSPGGGSGVVFGDGVRCASGTVIRLGTKTASGGSASYPTGANPHVSVKGAVPPAGGQRYYQCWYRNSAVFCTSSTFNLTNGISIVWLP